MPVTTSTTKQYSATSPHRNEKWLGNTLRRPLRTNDPAPSATGDRVDVALDETPAMRGVGLAWSSAASLVVGERSLPGQRPAIAGPALAGARGPGIAVARSPRSRLVPGERSDRTVEVTLGDEVAVVVDVERELRERPRRRAADGSGAVDRIEHRLVARTHELTQASSGGRVSMPKSPTEHPAWVQIFEYATQPSTAPPSSVRCGQRIGGMRSSTTWESSTPMRPSGNTVTSSPGSDVVAAIGAPSAVTRRRPARHDVRPRSPRGLGPERTDRADEADQHAHERATGQPEQQLAPAERAHRHVDLVAEVLALGAAW